MLNFPKFSALLSDLCKAKTRQVFQMSTGYGFKLYSAKGRTGKQTYAFRKGKLPTSPLIVCHADTVVKGGDGPHDFSYDPLTHKAVSIALDDRLGIACMFYGIKNKSFLRDCAMLICDDEEIGNSSAQVFTQDIAPNFLVELDRRGTDVVCYQYDSALLRSLIESVGFRVGNGSFSDICYLENFGVVGFNVGVGYHREHSTECHAVLTDTDSQLTKLGLFFDRFSGTRLAYDGGYDSYDYYDSYGISKPSKRGKGSSKYWPYTDDVITGAKADEFIDWESDSVFKDWNRRMF